MFGVELASAAVRHTKRAMMKMDRKRFEQQLDRMHSFWDGMKDTVHGGFYGRADAKGEADPGADKGTILMSRILWFYSRMAMIADGQKVNKQELLESAYHAYLFLKHHCFDPEYGGAFEMVHADGSCADEQKNAYTQSFVMLALASYAFASGSGEALRYARQFEGLLEEKYWDGQGYRERLDRTFRTLPESAAHGSGKEVYTLGTVIQLLESHLALFKALAETGDEIPVQEKILRHMHILRTAFNDPQTGLLFEYAIDPGHPDNYISCGHNAIAALLSDRASGLLGCGRNALHDMDTALSCPGSPGGRQGKEESEDPDRDQRFSDRITKLVLDYFIDREDGAADYELRKTGRNKNRIWWAQADVSAALYHAYAKYPDEQRYLDACEKILSFADRNMTDPVTGEWTEYIREQEPMQDLVHSWKGPYHTGRMCFEILKDMR